MSGLTWTCRVWGAFFAFALDLTDSKEGSSPPCSSFPCATYDPPLLRLLSGEQPTVFGLFWIMLKTSDLPVALFAFFKSLTQTFRTYTCTSFLLRLRTTSPVNPLLMLQINCACFHYISYCRPVVIRDLPYSSWITVGIFLSQYYVVILLYS